jgi:hypothetical protein
MLNHDPKGPAFEHGDRMSLNRLKLAIKYRQKKVNFDRLKLTKILELNILNGKLIFVNFNFMHTFLVRSASQRATIASLHMV